MDLLTPEAVLGIGVGLALAAAAGFRVFVPLLVLSLAARTGWIGVSPAFDWIAGTPAMVVFGTATLLEVAAYYVPFFDNLLDTIATPVAVLAGMLAGAAVLTDLPPWLQYTVAIVIGGGTAGIVQTSTTLLRLGASTATGGVGNFALATLELAGAVAVAILSVLFPLLALLLVAGLLALALRLLVRRGARRRSVLQH